MAYALIPLAIALYCGWWWWFPGQKKVLAAEHTSKDVERLMGAMACCVISSVIFLMMIIFHIDRTTSEVIPDPDIVVAVGNKHALIEYDNRYWIDYDIDGARLLHDGDAKAYDVKDYNFFGLLVRESIEFRAQ